jgi:type I restriction enzyme S subunit
MNGSSWGVSTVGEVARLEMGQSPDGQATNTEGKGVPLIGGAADYEGGTIEALRYTTQPTKICREGDLILCIRATIGRVAAADKEYCLGRGVAGLRASKVTVDFLRYFLTSQAKALDEAGTGTTFRQIDKKTLASWPIPLPAPEEQRRIVAKLDRLFKRSKSAREELARIPRLGERYKQAILAAAFRGELTTPWRDRNATSCWSIEDQRRISERRKTYIAGRRGSRLRDAPPLIMPGTSELPKSWMTGCLADVADLRTGYAFKSTWFSTDGPKLLRGANIAPGRVVWDDTKRLSLAHAPEFEKDFRLRAGDMVIAMDRPLISGGLKAAILRDEDDGAFLVQRVASPVCSPFVVPKFLWFLINSRLFIERIEQHATGSDLPHISSNDILTTPMPLPPLEEQLEIVRIVEKACDSISKQLTETLRASELLNRLDQATLSTAFRGELLPDDGRGSSAPTLIESDRASSDPIVSRPKSPENKKKNAMPTLPTESVKEAIRQMPTNGFTFDDLRRSVTVDYENLREVLFGILGEANPAITQTFDPETKSLYFVKGGA